MTYITVDVAASSDSIIDLGNRNGLELAIRARAGRTQGKIITEPDSVDLIRGVGIQPIKVFPDDRGYFSELARLGAPGIAGRFSGATVQVSCTMSYPETIKAIHYHYEQSDLWVPIHGMIQVVLCDLRRRSETFGVINTIFTGSVRPWEILIPPGIGHGYKVIGNEPLRLVYLTDRYFNGEDEGRLPFDHPAIGYDWEKKNK